MLLAVSLLALLSVTLAIPVRDDQQIALRPSNLASPKVEVGWADPRILGGQFIDVS
jgi:hypothetical protein